MMARTTNNRNRARSRRISCPLPSKEMKKKKEKEPRRTVDAEWLQSTRPFGRRLVSDRGWPRLERGEKNNN